MNRILFISIIITALSCDLFLNEQFQGNPIENDFFCEEAPDPLLVAETMPVLQGGLGELQKTVVYPELAKKAGIEGRVTVQFVVSETGNVLCATAIRGIGGGCDEAAVFAVSNATFNPGMQDGLPIKVEYSLPIVFRLQD
jgi:protein TonB